MLRTRVFEVIEERGQKQRWLLAELERRGYHISEGYLSQIKAGVKQPGRQFIEGGGGGSPVRGGILRILDELVFPLH